MYKVYTHTHTWNTDVQNNPCARAYVSYKKTKHHEFYVHKLQIENIGMA